MPVHNVHEQTQTAQHRLTFALVKLSNRGNPIPLSFCCGLHFITYVSFLGEAGVYVSYNTELERYAKHLRMFHFNITMQIQSNNCKRANRCKINGESFSRNANTCECA